MEEVFDQIEAFGKAERRIAMATLVATKGTSPKKEGAKMWVSEAGRILGSVTIGGCVDARVIEESEEALASLQSRLLSVDLGEEDAWEGGFTCAGNIRVMIEPLNLAMPAMPESLLIKLYRTIRDEVGSGRCAVLATPLEDRSSKLLIFEDGRLSGTLGEVALDREAREMALELIQKRTSRTVTLNGSSSAIQVFFEVHGPSPTLIIFGAGPVSMHLVNLGREMGLKTIVVDGRPRFATRERFPNADQLLIGIPSEIAETLTYTSSTFIVLTAHDYKYDIPVLKTVLGTEAAYIGLLGSKRRGQAILKFLKETGLDEQALGRVRVPTGLDIGAQTAAEIALSILAEAVAVKATRTGKPMREQKADPMTALYSEVLLDHFRHPRNYGKLSAPDIIYEDVNPLCGDRIRIELMIIDNVVIEASFQGDACAISIAAASMLTELIMGTNLEHGASISGDELLSALKSDIKPARMKCAMLPLEVLRSGLKADKPTQPGK